MTAKETERLAKVEQKVDDLVESTNKGFGDINTKLDAAITRMDNMNKSFVTVAQAKVVGWFIGLLITLGTLAVLIINAVQHK